MLVEPFAGEPVAGSAPSVMRNSATRTTSGTANPPRSTSTPKRRGSPAVASPRARPRTSAVASSITTTAKMTAAPTNITHHTPTIVRAACECGSRVDWLLPQPDSRRAAANRSESRRHAARTCAPGRCGGMRLRRDRAPVHAEMLPSAPGSQTRPPPVRRRAGSGPAGTGSRPERAGPDPVSPGFRPARGAAKLGRAVSPREVRRDDERRAGASNGIAARGRGLCGASWPSTAPDVCEEAEQSATV